MKFKNGMTAADFAALRESYAHRLGGGPALMWANLFAASYEALMDGVSQQAREKLRSPTFDTAFRMANAGQELVSFSRPLANQILLAAWAYGPDYQDWMAAKEAQEDADLAYFLGANTG